MLWFMSKTYKPAELAHSLFCSCVCFCLYGPFNSVLVSLFLCLFLYGPFNCISFHKFSRQTLCLLTLSFLFFFSFFSALSILSAIHLFTKVSLSSDIILCGWLGLKHQLTNQNPSILRAPQLASAARGVLQHTLPASCWPASTLFRFRPYLWSVFATVCASPACPRYHFAPL